jgi:hypothetical protein
MEEFQVLLTQDPLVTVAITEPDSPTAVSADALDQESALVSWQAPEVTGGSPITEYTATSKWRTELYNCHDFLHDHRIER